MFGATQFMFTGGRSRLRPPNLAGAPYGLCGGIRDVMASPDAIAFLPHLAPDSRPDSFWIATGTAGGDVLFKQLMTVIARARDMATPTSRAVLQIKLGRAIVEATAILF